SPVADKVASVGEQSVVRMHDALRRAGGTRGEREIDDLVRVVACRGHVWRLLWKAVGRVDDLEGRQLGQYAVEINFQTIGAPTLLSNERSCRETVQEHPDLATGVG